MRPAYIATRPRLRSGLEAGGIDGRSGAGRGLGFTGDSWRRCGRVISESILDGGISKQLWACFSRRSRENGILKVCGGSTAEQA